MFLKVAHRILTKKVGFFASFYVFSSIFGLKPLDFTTPRDRCFTQVPVGIRNLLLDAGKKEGRFAEVCTTFFFISRITAGYAVCVP